MHKNLRRFLYALAIAAVLTAGAAGGSSVSVFSGFERRSTDSLFPSAKHDPHVVVISMDPRSEEALGINPRDPWPRKVQGAIAEQLAAYGVQVGVWDVVFVGNADGDAELTAGFEQLPRVVLAETATLDPATKAGEFWHATPVHEPAETFTSLPNVTVALADVLPDPSDNVTRTIPVLVDQEGHFAEVPTLSLAAFEAFYGVNASNPTPDSVRVPGVRRIPTEEAHVLRLNWAARLTKMDSPAVISVIDLLRGDVNPRLLRGNIAFVGDTDPIHHDFQFTPVNKRNDGLPGVMIHANALNTMFTSSFLKPASDAETTATVGLLALLVALLVLFPRVWISVVVTIVLAIGFVLLTFVRFDDGHVMNIVYGLTGIALAFVMALGVRYMTETRHRRRVSNLFAQYVPEAVAKELEESGQLEAHVEGERIDVGLFFCDLRGFTSLSATLEPTQVRAMLNKFYDLLTEIIHSYGGTVLKFVGDEVFAVFGAPLPCENNAQATLDCAMEIQGRAAELDAELADLQIPPVKFGIGMNAGDVVAAHIGGGRRRQYDIVGDTVNLASRLCSQAGKGEIVLPESMIERFTTVPEMESMGAVQLKGLEQPVPLFKVAVGESEPRQPAPAPA